VVQKEIPLSSVHQDHMTMGFRAKLSAPGISSLVKDDMLIHENPK